MSLLMEHYANNEEHEYLSRLNTEINKKSVTIIPSREVHENLMGERIDWYNISSSVLPTSYHQRDV